MKQFAVVSKVMGEKENKSDEEKLLPNDWPATVEEFETKEAAEEFAKGKRIFSIQEYNSYKEGIDHAWAMLKPAEKKPFWKFWR